MKKSTLLIILFLSIRVLSQETVKDQNLETDNIKVSASTILKKYLQAIGASEDKLDSITSISTKYKATTAMGEFIWETTTTPEKIHEKLYMAGNLLFEIVATKNECYQISQGEKKLLAGSTCNDFKPFIGLMQEIALLSSKKLSVKEIQFNGEKCFSVEIPGESTTQNFVFSSTNGFKINEISLTKSDDKITKTSTVYKEYKAHNKIMFPSIRVLGNFIGTGIDVEFKLEEVKFNTEESKN